MNSGQRIVIFLRVFLLISTAGTSLGIDKHWLPDLEWQTGNNWVGGLLPDVDSRVIFPEQMSHTVGLPNTGNLEIAELYLPREGSLALGQDAILKFKESKNIKNVEWGKKGKYLWIDPKNWDGYTDATPHSERIPCDTDVAVLPNKNRILNIVLPQTDVRVRAVRFADDNTNLYSWEWLDLTDEPGIIKSSATVTYASALQLQLCEECTCHKQGDMDELIAEEVCAWMWKSKECKSRRCEYPLKVEGHCCEYCGGRISLSSKASLRKVETLVSEALENYRSVISWHVRKTWNGNTEVLIAENGVYTGINSQEAVTVLSKILIDQGYEVSEIVATGAALDEGSFLPNIFGPMLGIPVILILLMLAAFPYFGYSYSQVYAVWREALSSVREARSDPKQKSGGFFGFARFENVAEGDVRLAEAAVPATESFEELDSDVDGPSLSSKRFENPLYRSKREIEKGKNEKISEEKMIDIDSPVSLAELESRIREDRIEEINLD